MSTRINSFKSGLTALFRETLCRLDGFESSLGAMTNQHFFHFATCQTLDMHREYLSNVRIVQANEFSKIRLKDCYRNPLGQAPP